MVRWLEKGGADTKKVRFIELPFPQMGDALFQNRVDAVWNVEPFVTIMTQTGNARVIAYPYLENVPGMDLVLYLAKESWLNANHDTAAGFRRGIEKATKYLNSAPKQERDEWVAKFTGVKPELVAIMNLPVFSTDFNVASLKANLDIAVSQKIVKPFDVETMIWKP
jgi:NitT/TauT family transport system substrate-binding protein